MVRMRVSSPLLHFLATTLVLVLLCGTGWGFGGFTVTPASLVSGGQHAQLNVQGGGLNNVVLVYFLPIGSAGSPTGTAITVDSYRSVSNTLLMMDVTVRPDARPGSYQMMIGTTVTIMPGPIVQLLPGSSFAAPLQVRSVALVGPRDGTMVSYGDELYGEAVLAGSGTGTVLGEWLWDGAVSEQFTALFAAGERVTVKTERSFTTLALGGHTLALRVTSPNVVETKSVHVNVTPGNWQAMRLVGPVSRAGYAAEFAPTLSWTMVPGASGYQVGFSSSPSFRSVTSWYEVADNEWKVPDSVWKSLSMGELFWTVRVVIAGEPSRPAPMRRIIRSAPGVLASTNTLRLSRTGSPILEWQVDAGNSYYRVTVSRDPEAHDVMRRYLTPQGSVDLVAIAAKLEPGRTYYWQVESFSPDGRLRQVGPVQTFDAPLQPKISRNLYHPYWLASAAPVAPPSGLDAYITKRQPAPGESVKEARPSFLVEFQVEVPKVLSVAVDDTDVTAFLQMEERQIGFRPFLPLTNGAHKFNVASGEDTATWSFTVAASGNGDEAPAESAQLISSAVESKSDAEPETAAAQAKIGPSSAATPKSSTEAKPATPGKAEPGKTGKAAAAPATWEKHSSTHLGVVTEWASGSEADTNQITVAEQATAKHGRWNYEVNGSGMLLSTLGPEPRSSIGHFNDWVTRMRYIKGKWGMDMRFGVIAPLMYSGAEFVTPGMPRQALESAVLTPAGKFSYFINTNDAASGAGLGSAFHQQLMGSAWEAPLPPNRSVLRLLWLNAYDNGSAISTVYDQYGNPVSTSESAVKGSGDAYGSTLYVKLREGWNLRSEYAWSYNNTGYTSSGTPSTGSRLYGRAWKAGINGLWRKFQLIVNYRDVTANYATPANTGLMSGAQPDRRGLDANLGRPTPAGQFNIAYVYQQNSANQTDRPELILHNLSATWAKSIHKKTSLWLQVHEVRNMTGDVPAACWRCRLTRESSCWPIPAIWA